MANIKTIALTGAETAVYISGQNCDIRNDDTDIVYASAMPGVTAGADGVLSIPAGGAAKLLDTGGAVYLLGTGSVQLCGNDYSDQVFKVAASASGGGGTEDIVARTAINTHAANGEIHITESDRATWNAKAEISDFPASLPANGGTAAEVNSPTGKAKLYETTTEGGNLRLTSPDGTLYMEEDCYNNTTYRKYVVKDGANKAIEYYNSTTNTNEVYPITKVKSAGDATQAQVRNLSSGTDAASLANCGEGCWYGQYS